jgi:hypothetical protein
MAFVLMTYMDVNYQWALFNLENIFPLLLSDCLGGGLKSFSLGWNSHADSLIRKLCKIIEI